jgi:hypothetical protein
MYEMREECNKLQIVFTWFLNAFSAFNNLKLFKHILCFQDS